MHIYIVLSLSLPLSVPVYGAGTLGQPLSLRVDGAASVVAPAMLYDVTTRARTATGRLLHFRANPPRVEVCCAVCRRVSMKCQSDLRPGQRRYCGEACRTLGRLLYGVGRAAVPVEHTDKA